jgi:hypothetical protein
VALEYTFETGDEGWGLVGDVQNAAVSPLLESGLGAQTPNWVESYGHDLVVLLVYKFALPCL